MAKPLDPVSSAIAESTKRSRGVVTPDGIDLGTVALIMNALSAVAALPHDGNGLTLWWADYGRTGEYAFRAWVKANGHSYELDERDVSLCIQRKSDGHSFATWRIDLPSHSWDCHPLHPDRAGGAR